MATTAKPTAKPGAAKAAKEAAAPASKVATPAKDEAADLAALSNHGSGDSNAAAAGAGEQGELGEGAAPGAAPNTSGAAGAATDGAATANGDGAPPESAPGDTGITAALTDDTLAAAANLAADAARKDDEDEDEPVAVLSRTLVNQTAYVQRLPRLGVIIGPGESLIVGFRDSAHQDKCERQIEQIRLLNGWTEGVGLHWGLEE